MTVSQTDINALSGAPHSRTAGAPPRDPAPRNQSPPAQHESGASAPTSSPAPKARPDNVDRILHLSVPVSATLADREMPIGAILALTAGSIIEFEVSFDSDLILSVSNRPIGRGQAVKVGEHFGLRITAIDTIRQRIDAMGGK